MLLSHKAPSAAVLLCRIKANAERLKHEVKAARHRGEGEEALEKIEEALREEEELRDSNLLRLEEMLSRWKSGGAGRSLRDPGDWQELGDGCRRKRAHLES